MANCNLCDCSSSCNENGNCCHDYQYYCFDGDRRDSGGWGDGDGYDAYGDGDYADGDQSYGQDDGYAEGSDYGDGDAFHYHHYHYHHHHYHSSYHGEEGDGRDGGSSDYQDSSGHWGPGRQRSQFGPWGKNSPTEVISTAPETTSAPPTPPPKTTIVYEETTPVKHTEARPRSHGHYAGTHGAHAGHADHAGHAGHAAAQRAHESHEGHKAPKEAKEEKGTVGAAAQKETYEEFTERVKNSMSDDASRHEIFSAHRDAWLEMLQWQQVSGCPAQMMDKDVANGQALDSIPHVLSAAVCQRLCTERAGCDASAWGGVRHRPGLTNVCFLKSTNGPAQFKDNPGVVASMACCRAGEDTKCPELVRDADLHTDDSLPPQPGVGSVEECQQLCTKNPRCNAFTWGADRNTPGLTDVCFMKTIAEGNAPRVLEKPGVVSGLPCGCRAPVEHALWPQNEVELFKMPEPGSPQPAEVGSAYCVILMRPYTYEASLLQLQFNQRKGVFACPGYDVFSNQEMILADGLKTKKIRSSQMCEVGGEFKTALNLRIFAAFWKEVFTRKDYMNYNWLVKADADTVFFYHRLPGLLQEYEDRASSPSGEGVYFNNCKFGMHGPLEVFSQNAILALQGHFKDCYFYFRKLCSGDCHWGEDLWVDQCLKRRANETISRVNKYGLLEEQHCDPEEDWDSCENPHKVAFHPFKSESSWQRCMQHAGG